MRIWTAAWFASAFVWLPACAGGLSSKPGVYEASHENIEIHGRTIDITYAKPVSPRSPAELVIFATGDAGWFGVSAKILEHIADGGYYAAGLDSKKMVKYNRKTGKQTSLQDAATEFSAVFAHAKQALGLPDSTPVIVTGMSRGAGLAVFAAAAPSMKRGVTGAIAIALTLESDYLRAPDAETRHEGIKVDEKNRILFYPILPLLGPMPVAVIQSTSDRYCPAAESRRLMGPDTPTLRLYEVKARNHGFGGGTKELMADLDDALKWIQGK
jgi:dienelactone hydrolase